MIAMTKRTRTTLFFALGTIFLLGAPAIILYSQGYRLDWQQPWFSQVGAFYFAVTPTPAEVFIEEKLIGRTARFVGTTLTKNFSPGAYHIRIQKYGYHVWEKNLEIFPRKVTEAKHIILLPRDPAFVFLKDNVQAFWLAPNKTEAILQKSNLQMSGKNTWALFLWDMQRNTEYLLYESPRLQSEILDIQWAPNADAFLFRVVSQEQVKTFIQRLDNGFPARPSEIRILNQSGNAGQQISFFPFEENQLLLLTHFNNSFALSRFDYAREQLLNPLAQNVIAFLAQGQQVLWLDQEGILWQQKEKDAQPIQLNQTPLELEQETLYVVHSLGKEVFIQENQTLYMLNQQTQAFEKFFTPFNEIVLSPDEKKLAILSGQEIWLYFLQDSQEQPSRSKGERVFLTRFSENITNLTWFGAHYLLFARGDAIIVSEIDNRDRLNIVELAAFPRPTFFWQDATKTLLVRTKDQIRVSEKLLP